MTCVLGEEVDLSSHIPGRSKLEAIGIARCDQDGPAVANPCGPLDLEGTPEGNFVVIVWGMELC